MIRSEKIKYLGDKWKPDRLIVIGFSDKEKMDACFQSEEYQKIANKREMSVDSSAVIVEEDENGDL